jgi:acetyltransferase-like isoleucine patch superfamily enzyme
MTMQGPTKLTTSDGTQVSIRFRRRSLRQHWQRVVRRVFWGMDVADSAWIAATALIDRTYPAGVHIGHNVVVDEEAVLLTHDLTRGLYLNTQIGPRSYVGARAIILPGITIGADCVIEPGAVVNRDVPAGSSVIGNPMTVTTICSVGPD